MLKTIKRKKTPENVFFFSNLKHQYSKVQTVIHREKVKKKSFIYNEEKENTYDIMPLLQKVLHWIYYFVLDVYHNLCFKKSTQ